MKRTKDYIVLDLVETFIEPRYRSHQRWIVRSLLRRGFNRREVLRDLPKILRSIRAARGDDSYGVRSRPFVEVLDDLRKFTIHTWSKWSKWARTIPGSSKR